MGQGSRAKRSCSSIRAHVPANGCILVHVRACHQDTSRRRACYRRRAPVQGKRRSSDDRGGAASKDSDDEAGAPPAVSGAGAAGSDVSMGVEVASDWVASEAQVGLY